MVLFAGTIFVRDRDGYEWVLEAVADGDVDRHLVLAGLDRDGPGSRRSRHTVVNIERLRRVRRSLRDRDRHTERHAAKLRQLLGLLVGVVHRLLARLLDQRVDVLDAELDATD